jgi:hypothetical protein
MSKYQLLRPLTAQERDRLKASITRTGVEVAIIRDENGNILDGHNRKEIADELGVECPAEVRVGLTEDEKRQLILELNEARRHLDRSEKRQLTEEMLKANPEMSDRQIAAKVGVSQPTVSMKRQSLEASGEVKESITTVGKDGVRQPRQRDGISSKERLDRAKRDHPDLYQKIQTDEMSVGAAYKIMRERDGLKHQVKTPDPGPFVNPWERDDIRHPRNPNGDNRLLVWSFTFCTTDLPSMARIIKGHLTKRELEEFINELHSQPVASYPEYGSEARGEYSEVGGSRSLADLLGESV